MFVLFKRFFQKNNSNELSKVEYWKKWNLHELFKNLHKAEQFLNEIESSKVDDEFFKFKNEFIEHLYEIEGDNVADFTTIWEWFKPKKEWETFCGKDVNEIGKTIFNITDHWKRNHDFLNGTIVFMNNEFGVVLEKTSTSNVFGEIRWDTNKEDDIEDWRGQFGSFLDSGGKIINQEHQFQFINNDGSLKI